MTFLILLRTICMQRKLQQKRFISTNQMPYYKFEYVCEEPLSLVLNPFSASKIFLHGLTSGIPIIYFWNENKQFPLLLMKYLFLRTYKTLK